MSRARAAYAGKIALVTGAASGLGRALALELLGHGATVTLADIDLEGCQATAAAHPNAHALRLDVSDGDAIEQAIEQIVAEHGRLDLMINNAGYSVNGEVRHLGAEDWRRITAVNLLGTVFGSQAAYRQMIQQGGGQIVNIASMFGLVGAPGAAAYATTKHAVVGFTRSLRAEAEAFGVRINLACPGFIDTGLFQNARYVGVPRETMLAQPALPTIPAPLAARKILAAAARDRAVALFPGYVWLYRGLDRHAGFLLRWLHRKALRDYRRLLHQGEAP